jgi:amino acid permease
MPLLFLPAKETVEELVLKGLRKMTPKENVICTFVLVFISYACAMFVPSIGDAMALAWCTTNPMVIYFINSDSDRFYYSCYDVLVNPCRQTN